MLSSSPLREAHVKIWLASWYICFAIVPIGCAVATGTEEIPSASMMLNMGMQPYARPASGFRSTGQVSVIEQAAASMSAGMAGAQARRISLLQQPTLPKYPSLPRKPSGLPSPPTPPPAQNSTSLESQTMPLPAESSATPEPSPAPPAPLDVVGEVPPPCPLASLGCARFAPPASGDLVRRARLRLTDNHRSLSNISNELLAVQDEVDLTERSLYGRVMDFQAAQIITTEHDKIQAAVAKERRDIAGLRKEVGALEHRLVEARQGFATDVQVHNKELSTAQAKLEEDRTTTQRLADKVARGRQVDSEASLLNDERRRLLAEEEETARITKDAVRELDAIRRELKTQTGTQAKVKTSLEETNDFDTLCDERVETLKRELAKAEAMEAKESTAATASQAQAGMVDKASKQQLKAEAAILRAEIKRAEVSGSQVFKAFQAAQADLKLLETHLVNEVRMAQNKINAVQKQGSDMKDTFSENVGMIEQEEARKAALEHHMGDLRRELSPVVYASVRAENDAYAAELEQVVALLQASKSVEAKSFTRAREAEAEAAAEREAADGAASALRAAEAEGRDQLVAAVSDADEHKQSSKHVLMLARRSLENKCKPAFEHMAAKRGAELDRCRHKKDELVSLRAQQWSLQETLKAQQHVAFVG